MHVLTHWSSLQQSEEGSYDCTQWTHGKTEVCEGKSRPHSQWVAEPGSKLWQFKTRVCTFNYYTILFEIKIFLKKSQKIKTSVFSLGWIIFLFLSRRPLNQFLFWIPSRTWGVYNLVACFHQALSEAIDDIRHLK